MATRDAFSKRATKKKGAVVSIQDDDRMKTTVGDVGKRALRTTINDGDDPDKQINDGQQGR
jgi:hypothetical protein